VEVLVRDSGAGISTELLPQVFDLFTQADHSLDRAHGGLGVGLAVVKGLIELHGGEVHAASEGLGRGSEFTLSLPVEPGAERGAVASVAAASEAADDGSRRILVVEDNPDVASTMRDFLQLSGHQVEIACTGNEGVRAAHVFHPDVVLCDLGLPGMDGFEVAAELRRDPETASAQIIAITGYGGDEDRRRSKEAGFDLHLTKPVDPAQLRQVLQRRSGGLVPPAPPTRAARRSAGRRGSPAAR
jgi:CheY-like chemotaxis protein